MTAAEKGGLVSSTFHFSQEYWASPLSKGSLEYSNSWYKEKQYIYVWLDAELLFLISPLDMVTTLWQQTWQCVQ